MTLSATPQFIAPQPVAQEILAWRAWNLALDASGEPRLHSLVHTVAWDGPTLVADRVPALDSLHGVYARQTREQLVNEYVSQAVIGEVALSGVVLEGERGYRAERATIRSLILRYKLLDDVSMAPIEIAARLEARYAVEVELDGSEAIDDAWSKALMKSGLVYVPSASTQLHIQPQYQYQYQQSPYANFGAAFGTSIQGLLGGL